jgi:hypothetical protein
MIAGIINAKSSDKLIKYVAKSFDAIMVGLLTGKLSRNS